MLKYNSTIKPNKGSRKKNKDIFTPKKRGEIMSAIKSKNTGLEKKIFTLLHRQGFRFQTHYKKAFGNPDIAFPTKKIAIFIDSDFWHGWRYPKWSYKLTSDFWRNKIEKNRNRDRKVTLMLRKDGWTVLRFWEHQIKKDSDTIVDKILIALGGRH